MLVSGTDGVGTKLKVAFAADRHDTVGIDLVAMCVNDIAVVGAEPLFFLDYFATGKLAAEQGAEVVKGIAEGCRQAGCALIGGETAELPGFYERGRVRPGRLRGRLRRALAHRRRHARSPRRRGDRPRLHRPPLQRLLAGPQGAPGEAPARLAAAPTPAAAGPSPTLLLEPTRIYAKDVLALLERVTVKSLGHITGGGLPGNVPRNLPDGTRAVLDEKRWERPPIFDLDRARGRASRATRCTGPSTWGSASRVVVAPGDAAAAHAVLRGRGLASWTVGAIEKGPGEATCEVVR